MWSESFFRSPPEEAAICWVGFSPDGTRVAVATESGWVIVYSLEDLSEICRELVHSATITDGKWSSDSNFILTASNDRTARLLLSENLQNQVTYVGNKAAVLSCDITRDNSRVATGGRDISLRIYETTSKDEIAFVPAHTEQIFSVSFSHDGRFVFTASADTLCRIWEVNSLICVKSFVVSHQIILHGTFSPNSCFFLTLSADSCVRVTSVHSGTIVRDLKGWRSEGRVAVGGFAKYKGKAEVYAANEEGQVIGWDLDKGEVSWTVDSPSPLSLAVDINPSGNLIAVGGGPDSRCLALYRR